MNRPKCETPDKYSAFVPKNYCVCVKAYQINHKMDKPFRGCFLYLCSHIIQLEPHPFVQLNINILLLFFLVSMTDSYEIFNFLVAHIQYGVFYTHHKLINWSFWFSASLHAPECDRYKVSSYFRW